MTIITTKEIHRMSFKKDTIFKGVRLGQGYTKDWVIKDEWTHFLTEDEFIIVPEELSDEPIEVIKLWAAL